jgi:type I restriction enzyme, S subunit
MKKGWEVKTLGDIAQIKGGKRVPKGYKLQSEPTSYAYIRVTDFNDFGSVDLNDIQYINEEVYNQIAKYIISADDLYISIAGTIGKSGIIPIELDGANLTENACKLVFNEGIDTRFVYYFTISESFIKQAGLNTRVAAMPKLALARLSTISLAIPPLAEQQRIVAILDEAFAAIDQAKENVQRNLQNVKDLFQSELNSIFTNKGEGWVEKKLSEITTKIGSGATPRGGNESYKTEGISLIRSMNVHDRYFKDHNLAFIDDAQAAALSNVTLEEEDVLLNITGASIARCCVVPNIHLPARVNQHVSIIRGIKSILNPYFLNLLLTSKPYKDQLLQTGEQGSTRQAVTKAQLLDLVVSIPSVQKQNEIVDQLNTLSLETKQLEILYQKKLNTLEELKKSILQKAFSGELTAKKELAA